MVKILFYFQNQNESARSSSWMVLKRRSIVLDFNESDDDCIILDGNSKFKTPSPFINKPSHGKKEKKRIYHHWHARRYVGKLRLIRKTLLGFIVEELIGEDLTEMYELSCDVVCSHFKLCVKQNRTKNALERVVSFKTRPRINIHVCFLKAA